MKIIEQLNTQVLTEIQALFLDVLRASLRDEDYPLPLMDPDDFLTFLRLADKHYVLPLICESIYLADTVRNEDSLFAPFRTLAIDMVAGQTVRTARFLELHRFLNEHRLRPIIVKGIILRQMYFRENFRSSSDEDLWIFPSEFESYHAAFCEFGLELYGTGNQKNCNNKQLAVHEDLASESELAYFDPDTELIIELHVYPFPPDSIIYGSFNSLFTKKPISVTIKGQLLKTLTETEHLLFLFLHLYKHFIHGGFGIRQVCDVVIFSEYHRERIDWSLLRTHLQSTHTLDFARALYRIGDKYLVKENNMEKYLAGWNIHEIDEMPLLLDILECGIYGQSLERLHSSVMTLHAAATKKTDVSGSVVKWIFLPLHSMIIRYPYLSHAPFLLPIAWMQRIFGYLFNRRIKKQGGKSVASDVVESVRIGSNRVNLMRQYHLIDNGDMH